MDFRRPTAARASASTRAPRRGRTGHSRPGAANPPAWRRGRCGLLCFLGLGIGGLFGLIWLQVAGNLIFGLAGRLWVFLAAVVVYLVGVPDLLAIGTPASAAMATRTLPCLS